MQKRAQYVTDMLHDIIQSTKAKNAKEKLKKILYHLGTDLETHSLDMVLTSQINNPYFCGQRFTNLRKTGCTNYKQID